MFYVSLLENQPQSFISRFSADVFWEVHLRDKHCWKRFDIEHHIRGFDIWISKRHRFWPWPRLFLFMQVKPAGITTPELLLRAFIPSIRRPRRPLIDEPTSDPDHRLTPPPACLSEVRVSFPSCLKAEPHSNFLLWAKVECESAAGSLDLICNRFRRFRCSGVVFQLCRKTKESLFGKMDINTGE